MSDFASKACRDEKKERRSKRKKKRRQRRGKERDGREKFSITFSQGARENIFLVKISLNSNAAAITMSI